MNLRTHIYFYIRHYNHTQEEYGREYYSKLTEGAKAARYVVVVIVTRLGETRPIYPTYTYSIIPSLFPSFFPSRTERPSCGRPRT